MSKDGLVHISVATDKIMKSIEDEMYKKGLPVEAMTYGGITGTIRRWEEMSEEELAQQILEDCEPEPTFLKDLKEV